MEALLNRYRNLTVLLIAFFAQLVLIAYQVRTGKDVPLLRVWTVTAVSPVEQALEFVRRNTIGVVQDYFVLVGVRSENEQLKKQMGELKLRNHYLQSELSTAERVKALSGFQAQSPSRMLAARVIGTGTGTNSQVVFIDRGSASEVQAGMAVITPDGIVGKVIDSYPTAALVMLATDPSFAAGVISQKNHTRGTLKGQGQPQPLVDYVQNEQKVEVGEMFFTSGDDRIFPKGFPVGKAEVVKPGKNFKQIFVAPSAFQGGIEEVLVVLEGVHQPIPELEIASPGIKMLPPPPDAAATAGQATASTATLSTDADRLKAEYKQAGEAQKHVFGDGNLKPPDFSKLGQPVVVAKPLPDGRGSVAGSAVAGGGPVAGGRPAASGGPVANGGLVTGNGSAAGSGSVAGSKPVPGIGPLAGGAVSTGNKSAAGGGSVGSGSVAGGKPVVAPVKPLPDGRGSVVGANGAKSGVVDAPKQKVVTPDAKPVNPKPRGPLLVTDPSDVNPELAAPPNSPKPPKQQNQ